MKLKGKVQWYNKLEHIGVIVEENSTNFNEYYFSQKDLIDLNYLNVGDLVEFTPESDGKQDYAGNVVDLTPEPEECDHEFDMDEGGMCLNCGKDDWYNYVDEDYGQDR